MSLAYVKNPAYYLAGADIPTNTLLFNDGSRGTITTFSISPDLPEGLHFNPANGDIYGRPAHQFPLTTFTVEATGPGITELASISMASGEGGQHRMCTQHHHC